MALVSDIMISFEIRRQWFDGLLYVDDLTTMGRRISDSVPGDGWCYVDEVKRLYLKVTIFLWRGGDGEDFFNGDFIRNEVANGTQPCFCLQVADDEAKNRSPRSWRCLWRVDVMMPLYRWETIFLRRRCDHVAVKRKTEQLETTQWQWETLSQCFLTPEG